MRTEEHMNDAAMALYDIIKKRGWHDQISVGIGGQKLHLYFHEEVPQCYLHHMEIFRGISIIHHVNVGRARAWGEAA